MEETQQFHKLFEQREQQIMEEASQLSREVARKEFALLEFEMFYEVMVPKVSKENAENYLQRLRDQTWHDALKRANGDEQKAILFYAA